MKAAGWKRRLTPTRLLAYGFSALTLAIVGSALAMFLWQSFPVWRHEGLGYLTGKQWHYRGQQFGALPMIYGSVVVSVLALLLAAPIGIGTAVFAVEVVPGRLRIALKILVELLSGIPSVVYGLLGILFLRNWVYTAFERFDPLSGDTLLTASLLLAVMILPTTMTLSEDALRGVPNAQRIAARGLGLTRAETVFSVTLPQAAPGIVSAVLLGLGRALGETIAVFLVVGRQDNQWPSNLFSLRPLIEGGQTLTSKLGGSETNIAFGDPLHWAAIVGLGLILFALTAAATLASLWFGARRRDDA